jgi:hypothetical protein
MSIKTKRAGTSALSRFTAALTVAAAALAWPAAPARAQAPTVVTVNTTADVVDFAGMQQVSDLPGPDGLVTLREAIAAANNTGGPQTVAFNIPANDAGYEAGTGVFDISLEQGDLLVLTDDATTIDATTQTAFTGDTNPVGGEVHVRTIPPFANLSGLRVYSDNNTVAGIVGFSMFRYGVELLGDGNVVRDCNFVQSLSAGVYVEGANNRIENNTILLTGGNGVWVRGELATGAVVRGNVISLNHSHGVSVEGASGAVIGGPAPGQGNVINQNGHTSSERSPVGSNVAISGSNNVLQGNMIGVDATGTVDEGNITDGVVVTGTGHTIGGTAPGAGNVISGHNYSGSRIAHRAIGLDVAGSDVTILGNKIGTDPSGQIPLPNVVGVRVSGTNVRVGGAEPGAANTIALNARDGVAVTSGAAARISRNSIYGNGELGINLAFDPFAEVYPDTVTAAGAPVIDHSTSDGSGTVVSGHLDGPSPQTATVEIFSSGGADPSGFGEGQTFQAAVTPGTTGQFFVRLPVNLAAKHVTATATTAAGVTSEFSNAEPVTGGVPPSLEVVFPHAGDTWSSGTSRDIRWFTMGSVARVAIRVSYDGGAHFETLSSDVPNTGTFTWSIAAPATPNATVVVASVADPSLRDASDTFSLVEGPGPKSATPGVYVAATSAFFLRDAASPGPANAVFNYGPAGAGWRPVTGDWDADGDETVGLYDSASSTFFLRDTNNAGPAVVVFGFGPAGAGWVPIAGDWDADGSDTVGLYDPQTGAFFLRNGHAPGPADEVFRFGVGGGGLVPIAGDWDGDGRDTVGLYDPATGAFFLRNSNSPGAADIVFSYGPAGAIPVAADWNGDGADTIGVYVPASGAWFLRNANAGGPADVAFAYGPPNSAPLAGDWDGQ